jgi:hypothetical protein
MMKNIKTTFLSVFLIFSFISVLLFSQTKTVFANAASSNYNEFSITLLNPYIEKAIEDYYGYYRRYEIGDSQLEILDRKGNVFTVKVKVDTFEGAHNNYYTEILVFTVTPTTVTLNNYLHSDFYK